MPDNVNITPETKIVLTVKGFILMIVSILTIFASFYFAVVDPRINKAEEHARNVLNEYKESNDKQFESLKEYISKEHGFFEQGIKSALEASKANTERFDYIEKASTETENHGSSSGGDK